ncbi:MAG: hypothetical protein WA051_01095 [Minisyncoccia bacterium]
MLNLIFKRIAVFVAVALLSYFLPWQITVLILLSVAILVNTPIEYLFIVIGIFGGGLFCIIWTVICLLGVFVRNKTRIGQVF